MKYQYNILMQSISSSYHGIKMWVQILAKTFCWVALDGQSVAKAHFVIHQHFRLSVFTTNTFYDFDKCILLLKEIHLLFWTNTFWMLNKYIYYLNKHILYVDQIHFVFWTNTFCIWNKYLLQLRQITLVFWTNTFCWVALDIQSVGNGLSHLPWHTS